MKNSILCGLLKFFIIITLIGNLLVLTSCGSSRGWNCKAKYVYVPMTKEYIQKHQQGADSFDKIMLSKKVKP